jgi:hypothetical protein
MFGFFKMLLKAFGWLALGGVAGVNGAVSGTQRVPWYYRYGMPQNNQTDGQ